MKTSIINGSEVSKLSVAIQSARAVYEKLTDWVEKEKERERLEDEALEQRFE